LEFIRRDWRVCASVAVNTVTGAQGVMKNFKDQKGKIGYILLWLMGVPVSVLILIFLLRGCT